MTNIRKENENVLIVQEIKDRYKDKGERDFTNRIIEENADFSKAKLQGVNFTNAKLKGAKFNQAQIQGTIILSSP